MVILVIGLNFLTHATNAANLDKNYRCEKRWRKNKNVTDVTNEEKI